MGAIIAYSKGKNDLGLARREGMATLGKILTSAIGANATGTHVETALTLALTTCYLRYDFVGAGAGLAAANADGYVMPGLKIGKIRATRNRVVCQLWNDGINPEEKAGKLFLQYEQDDEKFKDGPGSDKDDEYFMKAVFPGADDHNTYQYLNRVAEDMRDIVEVGATVANKKNYLAAFKFLGRCK